MTQKCKNVKKRFWTQLTLTLIISLFYFGCGGSQGLHSIDQLPKWAQHPPVNCGLGAINYQGNVGLAKSGAIARGRDALARQLKTKVEGLMKDYQRQGDEGGVTFSESQITQVSEQTVKHSLEGSRMVEWSLIEEGKPAVYALVCSQKELILGEIEKNSALSKSQRSGLRQRAAEAFQDLDDQLSKHRKNNRKK